MINSRLKPIRMQAKLSQERLGVLAGLDETTARSRISQFNNERIRFGQLNEPIISLALEQVAFSPYPYALVVHDWSRLQFRSHNGKEERLKMTHGGDVGYELQTSLLVDATNGLPIAPLSQTLTDGAGCRSTLWLSDLILINLYILKARYRCHTEDLFFYF